MGILGTSRAETGIACGIQGGKAGLGTSHRVSPWHHIPGMYRIWPLRGSSLTPLLGPGVHAEPTREGG